MNAKGVSMILEYIILASILAVFVVILSLNLNYVLEESQLVKVVENQFSDVSAQASSQIADMIAVYPRNGNISARVFMPQKIGDIEYTVALEGNKIKIVSDDNRFSKLLSLGAIADLGIVNLSGLTHSLKEHHELVYQKTSCIFPTAVINVDNSSVKVGESITVDVSDSSPGSASSFEWRLTLWDGTTTEWKNSSETSLTINVGSWNENCTYSETGDYALCNIILEVKIVCEGEELTDTANKTILIYQNTEEEGYGEVTVEKFVVPSQLEVGETAYLHIRLEGIGISGGKAVNLTSVLALDSSGSMGDLELMKNKDESYILRLATEFQHLENFTNNGGKASVTITLPTEVEQYSFVAVKIPESYENFIISKIGNDNCPQKCNCTSDEKLCYVTDIKSGDLTIEVNGDGNQLFELIVYLPKIDSLKVSAIDYLNSLKEGDFAGLVEYDDIAIAKQVNSSEYLQNLTTDKEAVVNEVKNMVADGATNIYHALWNASRVLQENTTITGGTIPLIVLMTDGWPTVEANVDKNTCDYLCQYYDGNGADWDCPPYWLDPDYYWYWKQVDGIGFCRYGNWCTENCYTQIEQLAEQIKNTQINGENIRICTIGFGREGEYNATLLNNIASYINETTKCFFEAKNHEQLNNAFRTIKNYFDVIARDLTITDVIPSYVQVVGNVELVKEGAPVCEDVNVTNDEQNRTVVQLNCSEMRLEDTVELVIPIQIEKVGTFPIDVPEVSNVTFTNIQDKTVTVPLRVVSVRYGEPGSAQVVIR